MSFIICTCLQYLNKVQCNATANILLQKSHENEFLGNFDFRGQSQQLASLVICAQMLTTVMYCSVYNVIPPPTYLIIFNAM